MFIVILTDPTRRGGATNRDLRALAVREDRGSWRRRAPALAMANVLWFVLAGWWLNMLHLVTRVLLCRTIIGIPLAFGSRDSAVAGISVDLPHRHMLRSRALKTQ
jgi:hypothetical protein